MFSSGTRVYGRDAELEQLSQLVDRAAVGEPFVAVLEGEAGIGKSRLLDAVAAMADTVGIDVFRAQAYELEQERPFGSLIDALGLTPEAIDPESAALGLLLRAAHAEPPDLGASPSVQYAVTDGIVDLLQRRAGQRPIVLAVEDVHWADLATVTTLARLARMRSHTGVSLLCTARPAPRSDELGALLQTFDTEAGTRVALAGLSVEAVKCVAADAFDATPGPNLMHRLGGTSGNPLYVMEVLAALSEEGVVMSDGVVDVTDNDLPPTLRLTILRRLGFLPATTIDALRIAAVLGSAFRISDLTTVTGSRPTELLNQLRPALTGGVLQDDGDRLRFRHDLIHEATYTDLPGSMRAALHLDVARALEAAGADTFTVAHHYAIGTRGEHAQASDWLWRAGLEHAPIGGFDASLGLLTRALQTTPSTHGDYQLRRVVVLGNRLRWSPEAGSEDETRELLRTDLDDPFRWYLEVQLALFYAGSGRFQEAEELAFATLRSTTAQIAVSDAVTTARLALADPVGAERAWDELMSRSIANHPGDQLFCWLWTGSADGALLFAQAHEAALRAWTNFLRGNDSAAVSHALRGTARDASYGTPVNSYRTVEILAEAVSGLGEWRTTAAAAERIRDQAPPYPPLHAALGTAHWLSGDWDAALSNVETSAAEADEGGLMVLYILACAVGAAIAFHRDNLTDAAGWLDRADAVAPGAGLTRWLRGLVAEAEGRTDAAAGILARAWTRETAKEMGVWQRFAAPDTIRVALAVGDSATVDAVIGRIEELELLGETDPARAVALRCRGLVNQDPLLLLEAAALLLSAERPVDAAYAQEDAADLLAARGDTARARELLDAAISQYEHVQATRDIARAVRRLRDHGIRRRSTPATRRPSNGWHSLTDAEERVVELVAAGHTYREIGERLFISRRTVETHVSHVFTKLNLKSKVELANAFGRRTDQ